MRTLRELNLHIKDLGLDVKLVKGLGYFYIIGEGTEVLESSMICVSKFSELSAEQWVEEVEMLLKSKG